MVQFRKLLLANDKVAQQLPVRVIVMACYTVSQK